MTTRDNSQRWATRRAHYGPSGHASTAYVPRLAAAAPGPVDLTVAAVRESLAVFLAASRARDEPGLRLALALFVVERLAGRA